MRPLLRASVAPKASNGRLIVVEDGAWAHGSFLSVGDSDETALVVQGADEAPVELPFRVMGRIALIERAGRSVDRAAVVIAAKVEPQRRTARELIARTLHAHMRARGPGELVLAAHEAQAELRLELINLVEALLREHERSQVTMRLQFHDDDPRLAGWGAARGESNFASPNNFPSPR